MKWETPDSSESSVLKLLCFPSSWHWLADVSHSCMLLFFFEDTMYMTYKEGKWVICALISFWWDGKLGEIRVNIYLRQNSTLESSCIHLCISSYLGGRGWGKRKEGWWQRELSEQSSRDTFCWNSDALIWAEPGSKRGWFFIQTGFLWVVPQLLPLHQICAE